VKDFLVFLTIILYAFLSLYMGSMLNLLEPLKIHNISIQGRKSCNENNKKYASVTSSTGRYVLFL